MRESDLNDMKWGRNHTNTPKNKLLFRLEIGVWRSLRGETATSLD
jgi:hypothetical protein